MRNLLTLLGLCSATIACAQISLSGNSSTINVANNAPAIVVDNSLTISGSSAIDGARVSVSANFSSGDLLAYTGSLPSGVTGTYNSSTGVLTFTGSGTAANYQALLRTVTFRTTSASTTQRTVLFNLGSAISFSGNGHFYEYISGSFTWTTAKANAAGKNLYGMTGYLATITSQAENDFIQLKLSADGWFGASDSYTEINAATGTSTFNNQNNAEGKWYWVTGPEKGTQFSSGNTTPAAVSGRFMNWNNWEPNNSNTEHYAQIYSTGSTGKWNDLGASNQLGYVVEYGGLPGDPVVSLTSSRNITMIATQLITTASVMPYALNTTAAYVDNNLILYSNSSITNFRVTIASNFKAGDVLSYAGALPSGVTAAFNSTTGVLSFTGTATAAQWQTLLRSVKFNSTSTILGNRDITFSAGSQVAYTNGHFYEYVSTATNWTTAKTSAAAKTYMGLTGYLATITSQAENDFIQQKLAADAWIGSSDAYSMINAATGTTTYANQAAAEGKWYWVTGPVGEIGTQFSNSNNSPTAVSGRYTNWNAGEPNNVGGSGEDYGEIYSSGASPGKWNDLPNSSTLGYVVEYGGLASDALVFLSGNRTMAIGVALPLTGLSFTAKKNGTITGLDWSTLTEINTAYFEIQWSASGGGTFKSIGQVKAAGNSDVLKTYHWKHEHPGSGINYYRLKQYDIDGKFTISEVKLVLFTSEKTALSPNPAMSYINISLPTPADSGTIRVLNMNGQPVMKIAITPNRQIITLDIASLATGTYIAEIVTAGKPERIKFIKK